MGGFRLCKKNSVDPVTMGKSEAEKNLGAFAFKTKGDKQKEVVKVSFTLSRTLHTRLKLEATRRGETIVAMVSQWIAETVPAV